MKQTIDFPVTLGIVIAAVAVTCLSLSGAGGGVPWLTAERSAIGGGQLWRLFTGPFVHATWGHLFRDLVVVAVIGVAYEKPLRPFLPALVVVSLVVPAAAVLVFDPGLEGYMGLSGMSHSWIAAAITYELAVRPRKTRWLAVLVGAGFVAKLVYEQTGAPSVIPTSLGSIARPVPLAHAAGALAAFAVVGWGACWGAGWGSGSANASRRPGRGPGGRS